ncbi:MAG: site-2 protease family protein [Candidatus Gracilibacteria bacterium]|nr:site-2 protease family protein [Candidatus Gracilibacteria bacterium]
MLILGIITAIIIFSIVVLVHEWGHFTAARRFGVRVEEFGLGIPPRGKKLFIDKKGTLFTLNWLPLGGFVKLTGETPHTFLVFDENKKLYNNFDLEKALNENKDIFYKSGEKIGIQEKNEIKKLLIENNADYNLANKKSWEQAIIILAGIFMNFVLAFFIFFILFLIGIKPIGINTKIETNLELKTIPTLEQAINSGLIIKNPGIVLSPVKGSIAEKSGIKNGDILIKINNQEILDTNSIIEIISNSKNQKIDLTFLNSENKTIEIPAEGKIGVYLGENLEINEKYIIKYNLIDSLKYAFIETKNHIFLTFKGIGILVKNIFNPETPIERQEALESLSGPIGIVDFINKSLSAGIIFLIVIGAIISINLGVFNLLPIPALDGGRFIFITINSILKKIFGKKIINGKTEAIIHFSFFVLLIILSIFIAYNDIIKIISN